MKLLTSTRLRAMRRCLREHRIRYQLGYVPRLEDPRFKLGSFVHSGLENWWRAVQHRHPDPLESALSAVGDISEEEMDLYQQAKVRAMLIGYHTRWIEETPKYEVIAIEQEFRSEVHGYENRGWEIGGRLDLILRERSTRMIVPVEHKTSGEDVSPGSNYWERLALDSQVSIYHDGCTVMGYEPDGFIYDVLRKPELKPLKATPPESRKYTKEGRLYANQREEDETPEEYGERCLKAMSEDPEGYFQWIPVARMDSQLEAHREDMAQTLRLVDATTGAGVAPRSTGYECPRCPYFRVCCGEASLEDVSLFKKLSNVHRELAAKEEPIKHENVHI